MTLWVCLRVLPITSQGSVLFPDTSAPANESCEIKCHNVKLLPCVCAVGCTCAWGCVCECVYLRVKQWWKFNLVGNERERRVTKSLSFFFLWHDELQQPWLDWGSLSDAELSANIQCFSFIYLVLKPIWSVCLHFNYASTFQTNKWSAASQHQGCWQELIYSIAL